MPVQALSPPNGVATTPTVYSDVTNISGTVFSSSAIEITWTPPSSGTGYDIYRDGVLQGSLSGITTNSYNDVGLTASTAYLYKVVVTGPDQDSAGVSTTVTTDAVAVVNHSPVTNLTATVFSQTALELTWTPASDGASYDIYRDSVLIGSLSGITTNSFNDTGLTAGTTYSYDVVTTGADSGSSAVNVSATTTAATVLDAGAIFVSLTGSDSNDGSEASPLATVETAIGSLTTGQTLYLRGGDYPGTELDIENTAGTETAPILIKAYPDEPVFIDPTLAITWEVLDAANDIYVSTDSFDDGKISGHWYDGAELQSLIYYQDQDDFESTEFRCVAGSRYVGPGVFYDGSKIRIRTTPVPSSVMYGITEGVVFDPRTTLTRVTNTSTVVNIETDNVELHNIGYLGGNYGVEIKSGSDNIRIYGGDVYASCAVLVRAVTSQIIIEEVQQKARFPEHCAWTDIKGSDGQSTPASHSTQRTTLVNAEDTDGLYILNCHMDRSLDGGVIENCNNVYIEGNTGTTLDDFFQIKTSCNFVYVTKNDMNGPGPSHHGDGTPADPGTKYVYDNKFTGIKFLWGKEDPNGILRTEYTGILGSVQFSTHSTGEAGDGDPWVIYNNYVAGYTEQRNGLGYGLWHEINSTGVLHRVYNNVLEVLDDGYHDKDLDTSNAQQDYQNNTYIGGKFRESASGTNYDTLALWLAAFPTWWDQTSTTVLNASDPVTTLDTSWPMATELNTRGQRGSTI